MLDTTPMIPITGSDKLNFFVRIGMPIMTPIHLMKSRVARKYPIIEGPKLLGFSMLYKITTSPKPT